MCLSKLLCVCVCVCMCVHGEEGTWRQCESLNHHGLIVLIHVRDEAVGSVTSSQQRVRSHGGGNLRKADGLLPW